MCIMDYDTLQYCDFLGSVCSIWVTILCMARIKDAFKYVRPRILCVCGDCNGPDPGSVMNV